MSIFYLILTLNLILVVPVWRSSRLNPVVAVVAVEAIEAIEAIKAIEAIEAVPGCGGHAVLGPVNLLISLSGFLPDTINFDLAKLFNRCISILSKTDHFTLSF